MVSKDMDLIFMSALTAYPYKVDPWNPGEFKLPTEPDARGAMATENLERIIQAAGITWQHLIFRVSFTAPGGGGVNFGAKQGDWRSCSTSLRVTNTGVPGVNVLYQMTAAAPRRAPAAKGPLPGVEPLLVEPGMSLAPAIRVRSDVDLVLLLRHYRVSDRCRSVEPRQLHVAAGHGRSGEDARGQRGADAEGCRCHVATRHRAGPHR